MKDLMRLAYQVKMVCDNTHGRSSEMDKLEEVAEAIHKALLPFITVEDITADFEMFGEESVGAMHELLVSDAEDGMRDAIAQGDVQLVVAMNAALTNIYYCDKKKG